MKDVKIFFLPKKGNRALDFVYYKYTGISEKRFGGYGYVDD